MSINPLTFGSPVYSPPFAVSAGDTGVMKLRSMETAPLSHESLDENFTNLANKINEILGLNIDELNVTSDGIISPANLGISAGSGLLLSATGEFTHQNRPSAPAGYSTSDLATNERRFINAIDFDSFGHVTGFRSGTLNFSGSGSVSVNQGSSNQITISSSAYTSGSSPTFTDVFVTGQLVADGNVIITSTANEDTPNLTLKRFTSTESTGSDDVFDITVGDSAVVFTINNDADADAGRYLFRKMAEGASVPADVECGSLTVDGNLALSKRGVDGGNASFHFSSGGSADHPILRIYDKDGDTGAAITANGDSYLSGKGGNVGIGTTSPDAPLEIRGARPAIRLNDDDPAGQSNFEIVNNGGSLAIFDANVPVNNLFQIIGGQGATAGNVGIGSSSPEAKLEVIRGKNGFPNTDISADDVTALRVIGNDNAVLDMGVNGGSGTWIQSRNKSSDNAPYSLFLNPNGGNVGIGVTSPLSSANLDVKERSNNNARQYLRNNTVNLLSLCGQSSAQFGTETNHQLSFLVGNSIRQVITTAGNVGINNLAPSAKLDIVNTSTSTSQSHGLSVQGGGNSTGQGYSFRALGLDGSTDFFVRGDGNVGIGTDAPQELLTIRPSSGNSDYNAIRTSLGGSNESTYYTEWKGASGFKVHRASGSGGNLTIGIDTPDEPGHVQFTGTGGNIDFKTNSEGTYDTRLTILKDGNVGIGTTIPEGKLEIEHTGSWQDPSIHLKGQYPTIKFNDIGTDDDDWYIHVNSSNFYILADRDATGSDDPITSADNHWENPYPLQLNSNTNVAQVFGSEVITKANFDAELDDLADSSRVAWSDWYVAYSTNRPEDLTYDDTTKLATLYNNSDTSLGAVYKAIRNRDGAATYKITIRARASESATSGFYIGLFELDDDLPENKIAISHATTSTSAESVIIEDTRYQWLRSNGSIDATLTEYTYTVTVNPGCKWFSVGILNWTQMGTRRLFLDPNIIIEKIPTIFPGGLTSATGDYGSAKVADTRGVAWAGLAIRDDWVFMSSSPEVSGIYNDTDNEWGTIWRQNGATELYYDGAKKLDTSATGLSITGEIVTSSGSVPTRSSGTGVLTRADNDGTTGYWGDSNTYAFAWERNGNSVKINFKISFFSAGGFSNGGYYGFTGLPFTHANIANTGRPFGIYSRMNAVLADLYTVTIQSGKLYIWGGSSGVPLRAEQLEGQITYTMA